MEFDGLKSAIAKLKNVKHIGLVLLLGLCAILLLIVGFASAPTQTDSGSDLEKQTAAILSQIDGVGKVKVMIAVEKDADVFSGGGESVKGVIVVAEGADDMNVRVKLMKAVQTLLKINIDCIEIFTMK